MASDSRLDSSKLETKFEQDYVVHTTYEWELLEMRRQKISKWKKERVIGAGASGDVWLEKEEDGRQLRAVKKLSRRSPPKAELSQEVLVLAKVKEASAPRYLHPRVIVCIESRWNGRCLCPMGSSYNITRDLYYLHTFGPSTLQY